MALALAQGGYHPGVFAALSLTVWGAVLIGIAAGVLPRAEPSRAALTAGGFLALLAAVAFASLAWTSDQGAAFDEAVLVLAYGGLFAVVVVATRSGEAGAWLRGLAIGLGVVAVLALLSRLEPSLLGGSDHALSSDLPGAEGRLSYPIGYWNGLASAMAAAVVLLAWLGGGAAGRWARALAVGALPLPILVLYLTTSRGGVGAAVIGVAILLAAGRDRLRIAAGVLIGAGAGGILIALAAQRPELLDHPGTDLAISQGGELEPFILGALLLAGGLRYAIDGRLAGLRVATLGPRVRRGLLVLAGVIAVTVAVGAVVALEPAERFEEFKAPPSLSDASNGAERDLLARGGSSGRWQFWSAALDAFESDVLKGIGGAGYEAWWNEHGDLAAPAGNAHSLFLETLAELGLLGGLGLFGFFVVAVYQAIRRWREERARGGEPGTADQAATAALAVLIAATVGAAIDWTWELPAVFGTAIVAAALVCGPALRSGTQSAGGELGVRRSRRRFAAGVAVLLIAWLSICASALALLSAIALDQSRGAAGSGELEKAAGKAEDAVDLEPWAAEPRQQLALVYEQAGDIPAARRSIAAAIERAPEDWRLRLISARLAVAAGDLRAARESVVAAQHLNPRASELARPPGELVKGLRSAAG